jgi:RHS repeat-associated protein
VAATDYLFDQAGRLTGMTHGRQLPLPPGEGGGEGIFADYDWAFDEANRMTRFESLIDGVADYTNDDTGQLTGAEYTAGAGLPTAPPDKQYVYDENGNRVNNGYTVGPNNQLLSDGTHTYTYDEEGNRTSRTHIATGEVTEHHWDHRNRLVRVTTRATANGPLTTDIHYAYDFGQRWIRKTVDTNADGTIEESRIFVHDNGQIVLDFQKTGIGDAASGDLSHRYLWGHHVDQILADETVDTGSATDMAWTLTDHLNTVRDLVAYDPATDTTTVIKHITYGAFGNVTNDSAPGIDSLFLFTARPYDADTHLQNNLNRWYDLSIGRWISEDPIGFEAGDGNLYRYVANRPSLLVDPFGLLQQESSVKLVEFTYPLEPSIARMTPTGFRFQVKLRFNAAAEGLLLFQDLRHTLELRAAPLPGGADGPVLFTFNSHVRDLVQLARDSAGGFSSTDDQNSTNLARMIAIHMNQNPGICQITSTKRGDIRITDRVAVILAGGGLPTWYDPGQHPQEMVWAVGQLTDATGTVLHNEPAYQQVRNPGGGYTSRPSDFQELLYMNNTTYYRLTWCSIVRSRIVSRSPLLFNVRGRIEWPTGRVGGADGVVGIPVFPDKPSLTVPNGIDRDYSTQDTETSMKIFP